MASRASSFAVEFFKRLPRIRACGPGEVEHAAALHSGKCVLAGAGAARVQRRQ